MKKGKRSCLTIVLILFAIVVFVIAIMAAKDICPPQGPWPSPPWCDGSEKPFYLNPQAITKLFPTPLSFTVLVPGNTPEHTVVYIELYTDDGQIIQNAKLEKVADFEWVFKDAYVYTLLKEKDTLKYRYTRNNWGFSGAEEFEPDSQDGFRTISANDDLEIKDTVRKWRWMPEPGYEPPVVDARIIPFEPRVDGWTFQKGIAFADWWWEIFEPLIESTNARIQSSSITWVELLPPWDYEQVDPTPIISNKVCCHTYPDDKLRFHLDMLRKDSLSVLFEPQVCCTSLEGASFTPEWWDAWYEQYRNYLFYHVDIANEYGIEYFVVGDDWFVIEKKPENYQQRLTEIYEAVDERFNGKLGRKLYMGTSNLEEGAPPFYPTVEDMPYMDRWDFIAINFWAGISDSPDPTPEELDERVEKIFSTRFKPLYDQYGKPLVLIQVAFTSVDGGLMGKVDVFDPAIQIWEPYSTTYTLDLAEQAMGIDAIMRGVARHNYITGVYPFFYLPDTFPLSMEFNIRDKPAEDVLSQWYASIP